MTGLYAILLKTAAEQAPSGTGVPTMVPTFIPKPHQVEAVKRLEENNGRMIMVHAMGTGKASAHSAAVFTPSGPKRMGDIVVGDEVIDPVTGTAVPVLEVHPQGKQPIVRVTFSDGASTRVTLDHLWEVNTPSRKHLGYAGKVLSTSQLMEAGLREASGNNKFYVPLTAPVAFTPQEVSLDPYLLGLLLGDGCLSGRAVTFSSNDDFLVKAAAELAPGEAELRHLRGPDYKYLLGRNSKLRAALTEYGLVGTKSSTKFIPRKYLYNTEDVRTEVLQGLLDTDGTPSKVAGVEYVSVSRQLADDVVFLVQSLGGTATVREKVPTYTYKGEKRKGQRAYRLYIKLPPHVQPFLLSRKMAKYTAYTKYAPTRAIVAIEPDGEEEASCILVGSDSHLYLTDGFIVTHNTLTSIYGFEKMRNEGRAKKAIVITPAGLRNNFYDSIKNFTTSKAVIANQPDKIDPNAQYNVVSYETFRQDPVGIMRRAGADTMIVDEYHRVRNSEAATHEALFAGRQLAKNFIGLTASFINNSPSEIAPLLALSENNPNLNEKDFNAKFVRTIGSIKGFTGSEKKQLGLSNAPAFVKAVYPKVDFVSTEDVAGNDMPKKVVREVDVPMSDEQYRLYQLALNKLGPISEYIERRDPNIAVRDTERVFTQIGQARQIANSVHMGRKDVTPEQAATRTPKVQRVIEDTKRHLAEKPDNNVVLYTNLVHGGVDVLDAGLRQAGIDHALFIGKGTEVNGTNVTETARQEGVNEFKQGKKRVILISGAGAEGLDLKNATAFYALDGHFNPERVLQAEARARRLGGQAQRPPEQRVVDVRRYKSVAPPSEQPSFFRRMFGAEKPRTTDEWMYDVAAEKYRTNKQYYTALNEPRKYLRKEIAPNGQVRYIYPEEVPQQGLFARMLNPSPYKYETPK